MGYVDDNAVKSIGSKKLHQRPLDEYKPWNIEPLKE
jgi:hypothetical protein